MYDIGLLRITILEVFVEYFSSYLIYLAQVSVIYC